MISICNPYENVLIQYFATSLKSSVYFAFNSISQFGTSYISSPQQPQGTRGYWTEKCSYRRVPHQLNFSICPTEPVLSHPPNVITPSSSLHPLSPPLPFLCVNFPPLLELFHQHLNTLCFFHLKKQTNKPSLGPT